MSLEVLPRSSARPDPSAPQRVVGRYALFEPIAAGGMATVHLGRMMGPAGFVRVVAMKRMHPQYAKDPQFVAMFLDEARLAARIRHPNVVASTDVVAEDGELLIVMDYVEGESLSRLLRLAKERKLEPSPAVCAAIVVQALHGLHAAHEARNDAGMPLGIVHRDVSPQNVLVGADGVARVVDFGIARAAGRSQQTNTGVVKGKVSYMAPEQIRSQGIDRRLDVYAAGVVLWEALAQERLFTADEPLQAIDRILRLGVTTGPASKNPSVPLALDAVVLRATSRDPARRYETALEFADAIEQATTIASQRAVAKWVAAVAKPELDERAKLVHVTNGSDPSVVAPSVLTPASVRSSDLPSPAAAASAETAPALGLSAQPRAGASAEPPPGIEITKSVPNRVLSLPPPAEAGPTSPTVTKSRALRRPDASRAKAKASPFVVAAALLGACALVVVTLAIVRNARTEITAHGSASIVGAWPVRLERSAIAVSALPDVPTPPPPAAPTATTEPSAPSATASPVPVGPRHRPPKSKCDPPFYYENGFKRFKPGCL